MSNKQHEEPVGVYDEDDQDFEDYDEDDVEPEPAPAPKAKPKRKPRPIPANAPRPQDHKRPKQRRQVVREAEGDEQVAIEYREQDYLIPAEQDDWPITAIQAIGRDRHVDAIEELLGPRQWAQFLSRHNTRRSFREFLELVGEEFGFGSAGN